MLVRCSEKGCSRSGSKYFFPDNSSIVLCWEHAQQHGFCPMCGGFFGGVEFFEVHGFCLDCYHELDPDPDEYYDEEDELWEEAF